MWLITAVSCNWKQLLSANNTCLLIPFLAFLLFCRLTECLPTLKMALLMHNELSAACHAAAWRYRSSSSLAWTTENLRPKPRTAASPGKRKKKFRSLTVSALGFIYLNCTARQVHKVRSHADSSPIRLQLILVSQVSSAPACGFQVMKRSEYSEALLKRKRKTGIYSGAAGRNKNTVREQTLERNNA